ncbi:thiamineS protein [Thermaerobacter marianensis DSM 12885]|uniref:ThiamineS protein n=1 Tax=Thermaerobacter marianensis (strain ATCC 700841 / DSM 12885 / JCM 10246 / 7p75a) TaxID=644966 RepID=E6SHT1_THEM7|nr:MoaD/ThiS family protein [Thermaerobacter marianensis]ADU50778.1 thiamineS protein [Thermaerobacter marianensis DSM 12885]
MQVRVRLGPDLAKAAGLPVALVEASAGTTVEQLLRRLEETYPALRGAVPTALLVAGGRVLGRQDEVPEGAELALVQPMAGGEGRLAD